MRLYSATLYKLNEEVESVFFKKIVNINSPLYDDYYKYLINFNQTFDEATPALFRKISESEKLFSSTGVDIIVNSPYLSRYCQEITTGIKVPKLWIYNEGKKSQYYQISKINERVFAKINTQLSVAELNRLKSDLIKGKYSEKSIYDVIEDEDVKTSSNQKILKKIKGDKI